MEEIDIERLRVDLINYFGCATSFFPIAYIEVLEIENASYDKLIEIAINNGFDLDNYIINKRY